MHTIGSGMSVRAGTPNVAPHLDRFILLLGESQIDHKYKDQVIPGVCGDRW